MKFLKTVFLAAMMVFLMSPVSVHAQEAQPEQPKVNQERYGDWFVNCTQEEEERCVMVQEVIMERDGSKGRLVSLFIFHDKENDVIRGRFLLPLGIYLPEGMVLQIDETEAFQVPIEICNNSGCMLTAKIPADVMDQMRAGEELKVFYSLQPGKRFQAKMSLSGFTKASKEAFSK